jgi:zinc transport system ATP-binding protein
MVNFPHFDRMKDMDDILEVSALSVRLGGTEVFRNLNFQVRRGSSLAILGPNGSGKTVLFRVLVGAIPAKGVFRWAPDVRIGYVPQKLDIERDVPITGFDFLRARASLIHASPAMIHQILDSVGLSSHFAEQPIGALSGGQFQRLLTAFALVGQPNVLLLDEPTAGVDEPGRERLNDLIHRLQKEQGLTILQISHDLSVVHRYATTVLCLGHDRVWIGPPREILTPDLLNEVYGAPVTFHIHDN